MRRVFMLSICAVMIGPVAGGAPSPVEPESDAPNASTLILPCVPVGTYWQGQVPAGGAPSAPDLAIVAIDTRPKDVRVHLDDRFVGRARYLDGSPGYLYLEPGRYVLELRLGGYRTVSVALEADAGCRYDLKHRMERISGEPAEHPPGSYGKGRPLQRVYAPIAGPEAPPGRTTSVGPDLSLRSDIARGSDGEEVSSVRDGTLRLDVHPETAAVSIDGVFVATGSELARMEGPLAMKAGSHILTVEAPGHVTETRSIDLAPGQLIELEIELIEASVEAAR
jgi:hypothetical protein